MPVFQQKWLKSPLTVRILTFLLFTLTVVGKSWDSSAASIHFKQAIKWQESLNRERAAVQHKQTYLRIIGEFEKVWLKDPHYSGCDDAMFYVSQLWKKMGDLFKERQYLQKALDQFQSLLREYPQSKFSVKAYSESIGISCGLGQMAIAKENLQLIFKRFPKSREAQRAKQLVAKSEAQKSIKADKSKLAVKKGVDSEVPKTAQPSGVPAPTDDVAEKPAVLLGANDSDKDGSLNPPQPAQPPKLGEMTLTRTLGLKINRIVLDPGHGGHDTGTISKSGLMEKDLVLDLAIRLRRFLQEKLEVEVLLTRETDVFLSLEERTAFANSHKSDLFLSIHANSSRNQRINGVETFVLNWTKNREDQALAIRENAAAESSLADLQDLIRKITQNEKIGESRELAEHIQSSLFKTVAQISPGAKNRGVKQAPFMVLVGTAMPSALAEVSFLSNPKTASRLTEEDNRERLADGLYGGIERYVNSLSRQAGVIPRTVPATQ